MQSDFQDCVQKLEMKVRSTMFPRLMAVGMLITFAAGRPAEANIFYPLPGINGLPLVIDSSQSYLTVTGSVNGIDFVEQAPGSSTAFLEGQLFLDEDPIGNPWLKFGSYMKVLPNGTFLPGNSLSAYGAIIPGFWMGADAYTATRNIAFGIQGSLAGSNGMFAASKIAYSLDAGDAYIQVPGFLPYMEYYGTTPKNLSTANGQLNEHPLQTSITLPIDLEVKSLLYTAENEAIFHITGQIVARSAVVPEAGSLVLLGLAVPVGFAVRWWRERRSCLAEVLRC